MFYNAFLGATAKRIYHQNFIKISSVIFKKIDLKIFKIIQEENVTSIFTLKHIYLQFTNYKKPKVHSIQTIVLVSA